LRVVYTSENLALASLEFFVHLEEEDLSSLPDAEYGTARMERAGKTLVLATKGSSFGRYAGPPASVAAEIPGSLRTDRLEIADLPPNWRDAMAPPALREFGAKWAAAASSAALSVPSVLIPLERNYLLNPAHPDFARIKIRKPEPFGFDPRMWKRPRR
jgi:RES domain-containing protein